MFSTNGKGSWKNQAVGAVALLTVVMTVVPSTTAAATYAVTLNTPVVTGLTVNLTGTGTGTQYSGQVSQHDVQVNWGNGVVDNTSSVNFVDPPGNPKDFSGTWSNSLTFATGGAFTIIVKLYHQSVPGNESSGDAMQTVQVVLDACANVIGTQTTGPCADATCVSEGGTWTNNECDMPTDEELCEQQESMSWVEGECVEDEEETEECASGWTGVFPICIPPFPSCPEGWSGVFPLCIEPQADVDLCPEPGLQNELPCASITVDTDEDGVDDETDNCPVVANPDQLDSDEDGVGDVCDTGEEVENPQTEIVTETPHQGGGHLEAACDNNVDDDNDGLYDMNDPGCDSQSDDSEGGSATDGEVLGASTSCGPVLSVYLGLRGLANDPEAVKVVQEFLNKELGLSLEVNGEYDAATIDAVKQFQAKYPLDVLSPWGISDATGIVYKTTQRMINKISCPGLEIPMPELP